MLLSFLSVAFGCGQRGPVNDSAKTTRIVTTDIKQQVVGFCGDCHAYPPPDSFPKGTWAKEVSQGFDFYRKSGRIDLRVPRPSDVLDYYSSRAPEQLDLPRPGPLAGSALARFEKQVVPTLKGTPSVAVSDLLYAEGELFVSDMKNGHILKVNLQDLAAPPVVVAKEGHPCHLDACDVDGDGDIELLVSDLGSFLPGDHSDGRVILIDPSDGHSVVLAEHLGRVADARLADLTGNGLNDIVVAEFGWRETGRLLLLERTAPATTALSADSFQLRVLDDRHGASHVLIPDLDGDGDRDLIVLFSQEHERVVGFTNDGTGTFTKRDLFVADRPDYGSSCIALADLDNDGDSDVVYTNGDSMDSHFLKPTHSVQWLENGGELAFTHHRIGYLPGVYGAVSGDFDNDGDLDVVAVTMTWWYAVPFNSVVWFEQQGNGKFVRHNLDLSTAQHATVEVGDFDGDGDSDFVVGEFETRTVASPGLCTIWWNRSGGESPSESPSH